MDGPERRPSAELANLLAAIERAAGDLALAEEPARFRAALEAAAPAPPPPSADESRRD